MKNHYQRNIFIIFVFSLVLPSLSAKTDKYRLTLRDNPSTSVVIGWNQVSGIDPVVHYDTVDHGLQWEKYTFSAIPDRETDYAEMANKFVRLQGLVPNTAYYFVIRDSEGLSSRLWFRTAPSGAGARYSLIAGGDSRNNPEPRRNANLLVSKLKPHAVLFGGDMTVRGTPSQWKEWLDDWQLTISENGRMFPLIAARGNHEKQNEMLHHLFDVPSPGVYYPINFGDRFIRTYTLNTEISIAGEQTEWLKEDLENNDDVLWKIVQYHKPMRPHVASKREGNGQYDEWAQLFFKNGIHLVIECDSHTVKRTWPVRPSTGENSEEGFIRDDSNGTVYVGEGCWGAPLRESNDPKSWTRDHDMFNQFKWIFIDKQQIEVRSVKVDNAPEVASLPDDEPFSIPENIDIWNPEHGAVVYITP